MNPLLESFGNARTAMNANSSRFGKYIELKFGAQLEVMGASISEYVVTTSHVCVGGFAVL